MNIKIESIYAFAYNIPKASLEFALKSSYMYITLKFTNKWQTLSLSVCRWGVHCDPGTENQLFSFGPETPIALL